MNYAVGRTGPNLRAVTLALAMLAFCVAILADAARAHAGELLQTAGEQMLRYARAEHIDETRTVFVNGAAFQLSSGSTRDPVAAVLDVFEARCADVAGGFGA